MLSIFPLDGSVTNNLDRGSEKGSNIFLGAALEGRVKHTEYNYRDKVQFLDGRITYVVEPYGGYEKDRKDAAILVIADDPRTASRYDTRLMYVQYLMFSFFILRNTDHLATDAINLPL